MTQRCDSVTVSHLFNSPNCHIFAFGGLFELFVLECQVGTKSDSKAVGKRQKLLAKKIMFWALKADCLRCLFSKICGFFISRISRLTENESTTTKPNKFSPVID